MSRRIGQLLDGSNGWYLPSYEKSVYCPSAITAAACPQQSTCPANFVGFSLAQKLQHGRILETFSMSQRITTVRATP